LNLENAMFAEFLRKRDLRPVLTKLLPKIIMVREE
jgi:hypothetical protein